MRAAPLALVLLLIPACDWDGNFTFLGYTTCPNYATDIHTVRVPIFKNNTLYRGLEFELTRAVIREIESKTPYKVVSGNCAADTELTGTIVNVMKNVINRNQENEVREAETILAVEVYWKDLRTGEVLSRPRKGPEAVQPVKLPPGVAPPPTPVTLVQSLGNMIPELGQSLASAQKQNVDRLAVQIVSMMEKPW